MIAQSLKVVFFSIVILVSPIILALLGLAVGIKFQYSVVKGLALLLRPENNARGKTN